MIKYVEAGMLRVSVSVFALLCGSGSAAAQSVPQPWSSRDIGSPTLSGTASHASGVFTIDAAGADIWDSADQFHFVYQQISGDAVIVARIDDLTVTHQWAKAGVMIRASLSAGSAHGTALVSGTNGVFFQRRTASGVLSTSTTGSTNRTPVWLRAVRVGTRVTAAWSTNGTSWTTIGSDTIALGTSAYVGIAVTSHHIGSRTRARASNVRVTGQGLPAPQQSMDIGAPAISGQASFGSGTYTIRAAGRDIWDTSDQFHFVYQPVTGNVDVVTRVASLTDTHHWAKGGVMIRESLAAQSRHAMVVVSARKGYAFQRRLEPAAYSTHTTGGSGAAPGWVRLVRKGDLFEAYRSSNGSTWTRFASDTIAMGDTVYVGLAATSVNASQATTMVADNFRLTASTALTNQPPAISITAPASGSQFTVPATVTISATAADPENRMASVEFYVGTTMIARDTAAPYSASWSVASAGSYSLTAVAHDADGGRTTSSTVTVSTLSTTLASTTAPRLVVFGASTNHATSVTSYLFEVFAAGANPATATPVASSNLGKPTPASNNDITVDRASFFSALKVGTYVATITAIGPSGQARSASINFSR